MNEAQVPDPAPDADVQRPESTAPADAEPAEATAAAEPTDREPDIEIADLAPEPAETADPESESTDLAPEFDDEVQATEPEPVDSMIEPEFAEPVAEEGVSTGHTEIDSALRRLDELDGLPVEQHGEVYDELHGQLRDALTAAATPAPESSDD